MFNWYKGCLPSNEFRQVGEAINIISNSIVYPCLGGMTITNEKGMKTNYDAVDLLRDKKDIKKALDILNSFIEGINERSSQMIVDAIFESVWDDRITIQTFCKVNMDTKEVFNIEKVNIEGLEILMDESVIINDIAYPVYQKDEMVKGEYWYD